MGAFKIRGAFNMIAQLPKENLERGVITYSSGNHGQAVAMAAQQLGAPAVIVMPTTAPQVKVDGCKSYGAEVIMAGTTSLDRQRRAEKEARRARPDDRAAVRSPADHHRPGDDGPRDSRAVPRRRHRVRRRSAAAAWRRASAAAIKLSKPSVRIVAVEPEGAPKMTKSLEAGQPITLAVSKSIADGLMNLRPGDITFAHMRAFVDEVVTVSEGDIATTVAWLFRNARLVVEPSGAVTTAAVALGLGNVDPSKGPSSRSSAAATSRRRHSRSTSPMTIDDRPTVGD